MKIFLTAATVAATLAIPLAAAADATKQSAAKVPAAATAYAASMDRMMADMDVKPTGDPDKDFVSMMIPHHQGAIDMARIELKYGRDPMLRAMAEDVVKAQEKEIADMKEWRAKTGR